MELESFYELNIYKDIYFPLSSALKVCFATNGDLSILKKADIANNQWIDKAESNYLSKTESYPESIQNIFGVIRNICKRSINLEGTNRINPTNLEIELAKENINLNDWGVDVRYKLNGTICFEIPPPYQPKAQK